MFWQVRGSIRLPRRRTTTGRGASRQSSMQSRPRREKGPADYPAGQYQARTEAIDQPATWNLHRCIGEAERREDIAHLNRIEMKIAGNHRSGLADAGAIEIGEERERHPERDDSMPRFIILSKIPRKGDHSSS